MVTVYLDETEHSDATKYTVVAGFRGRRENWELFAPRWMQALHPRPSLHMKSLRWNGARAEQKIKPLLERLGRIPYECDLVPVYGAVKACDYIDLIQGESAKLAALGGYLLAISHVFTLLLDTVSPHERIKIVCEEQKQYEPSARSIFDTFRKIASQVRAPHPQLAGIEFVPKHYTSLIQPSDYLAFSLGKAFSEPESKKAMWSQPIQHWPNPTCKPGMWLSRDVARDTILQIKDATHLLLSW